MFKKLKDKIAEEVKQSPLKSVQQLAQAVVSPSSSSVFEPSSSNDKFCIEEGDIEEDEKQEQEKPGGFTSVTLTGQTTSPVREQTQKYGFRSSSGSLKAEADNLFPKFEPQPTNFHVQSDWESASEVEDRGSQLEHISKESLYEAYRKIYNRYNRTKNKYHEIVTHYRQLEREKEKAKTVLTETQDKALMRISELREQCLLEQQAKAHLEEALRNELEERDHIINTLRTKVQYLKGIGDISATESLDASFLSKEEENLIDFTENSSVSSVPLPFDASSNKEKIEWFEEKIMTLRNVLHEETSKIECLKSKLKEAREQCDHEDVNMKSSDDQHSFVTEHSEKELNQTISNLLSKIATEVQNLQKTAVHCSLLNTVNDKSNLEEKHYVNEKIPIVKNVHDEQSEIMKYTSKIKELEDKNKALIQKLSEESISAKELKNEFNTLSNTADILKKKIKLSNENFGKNDAINCLITDMENELIHEWNLCFQNFLQTRCEITVLKDTKGDLEKELFRIKEEKNKLENMNKEILEMNSKLKGDVEILQKDLKVHSTQIDNLNRERSDFKVRNENLGKKVKELEETLKLNEKVFGERQGDVQKILDEKKTTDNILSSLELELQNIRSEYSHISKAKEELDKEVLSLRKENNELMSEKEELNHKVNELENKFKIVEDDHKTLINTKDDLNNQLNSLSKDMEELTTERNTLLSRISNLDKDVENKELQLSLLVEGKNQLLNEIKTTKDESEIINREKLSLAEKINDLKDEFEKNKLNYSKLLETVQCHSDEICSLKKERDELIQGKSNLESKIADLNVEINAIEANCSENVEIKDRLSIELSCVREERDKLKSEIQLVQNRISDLNTNSKIMNEELSSLRKENAELMTEKSNMQEEIQRLEECLKTNNDNNSTFSEVNIKLTDELDSLKKEINDLVKEKSEIVSESKKLEDQLLISKEEFSKCSSEYNTLSEKLHILQAECHDLAVKYQTERDTTEQINKQLKEKEEELISVNEKNQNLSNEIEKLKNDYDQTDEEFKLLQAQYNNMVTEHEKHKELSISLLKIKNQLTNEVDSLKKDCDKALHTLNQTQSELQKEQDCSSELKKQVSYLSETLKKKCDETNEKYHENTSLRTEIDELLKKITVLNSCTEKLTKDKHSLLNHSLANVHSLKMIRELLTNLYDFVKEFQVEISHELSNINKKLQKDFLESRIDYHDSEKLNKKTVALECKSKQDIDSYNAKLKTQEGSLNILKEISQVEATDLEDSFPVINEPNMVAFRRMGHLEKSSELDNCISNVQNTCDPEAYLKKAISLMKSFTNLLNHNSVLNDYPDVDIFTPNNEKCIRLNEIEGKNIQKEIIAMESFITEFEAEYNKSDPQRISSKNSKDSDDNVIEMELRQEIKLKDEIIEKLQSVIEDYEQQKGGDDSAFLYSQKVHILEQENKSLSQKLHQVKETHELNVKNLISEYEKKLEEIEDEKHLYDFEKIGKEKTHVVNKMKEQIQNLQEDLEERGDAFEKLYEEHQQSVKSLDTEIHQLRSNHDKELREQDKKWRQCLDRRLAEEETRHRQELTALNTQWNAERRELETARRLAVNAVESGSGSNELLRRQVQALTVQLTEMRNNRCEACDRKRKSDAKELNPRSIQDCTEMEYLRNILYEYMMGKEPLVLAKVLCALVKFDENQTREIVSKEEHRITLFGQLGRL